MSRVVERVRKLLQLADPTANPNVHERARAAQQACELIITHRLILREPEPAERPSAPLVRQLRRWRTSIAARDSVCLMCGAPIQKGDTVLSYFEVWRTVYQHVQCDSG
jgi:hypothetical protein